MQLTVAYKFHPQNSSEQNTVYFNLNVLPIKKILLAGFTTTKQ